MARINAHALAEIASAFLRANGEPGGLTDPIDPDLSARLRAAQAIQAREENEGEAALAPTGHSPEEIRNWLEMAVEATGLTPTQLAKRAGVAPSTVNRFMARSGANKNVSATTIHKILRTTSKLMHDKFHGPKDERALSTLKGYRIRTIVIGSIGGLILHEDYFWPQPAWYSISVPVQFGAEGASSLIGFEVEDRAAERVYLPGSVLICRTPDQLGRGPKTQENVVVASTFEGRRLLYVGRYFIDADGYGSILSLSSDRLRTMPPAVAVEGSWSGVVGIIIAAVRPEPIWLPDP